MQTDHKLFDDLSKVTTSALGVLSGVRGEVEGSLRARFDRWLAGMDLVRRDEFDALKAMVLAAKAENASLAARIVALEAGAEKLRKPAKKA